MWAHHSSNREAHSTRSLQAKTRVFKQANSSDNGVIDSIAGDARTTKEQDEHDEMNGAGNEAETKVTRISSQAILDIVRGKYKDWTDDKAKGTHIFTVTAVAIAALLDSDATFKDGTPHATVTPELSISKERFSRAMCQWQNLGRRAQAMSKIDASPHYIGARVQKAFGKDQTIFTGHVVAVTDEIYHVEYSDRDREDLDAYELTQTWAATQPSSTDVTPIPDMSEPVYWSRSEFMALIADANTGNIATPPFLRSFAESSEATALMDDGSLLMPFGIRKAVWDWGSSMQHEHQLAAKHIPKAIERLHRILQPPDR